jgi:hypothetical protein
VSITLLEDQKVWGMIPREIALLCANGTGAMTALMTVMAVATQTWILLGGAAIGIVVFVFLLRLSTYLRLLAYAAVPLDE